MLFFSSRSRVRAELVITAEELEKFIVYNMHEFRECNKMLLSWLWLMVVNNSFIYMKLNHLPFALYRRGPLL